MKMKTLNNMLIFTIQYLVIGFSLYFSYDETGPWSIFLFILIFLGIEVLNFATRNIARSAKTISKQMDTITDLINSKVDMKLEISILRNQLVDIKMELDKKFNEIENNDRVLFDKGDKNSES